MSAAWPMCFSVGVSTSTGTPAVAGCRISSANAGSPMVPLPMFSCRSRVEPHRSFESFACTSRSRSAPTVATSVSRVAVMPPSAARS